MNREPVALIDTLLELCEKERAALGAGDLTALGAIALARTELAGRLRGLPPSGAETQARLWRLRAEVRRNLSLYGELIRVTTGYRRWLGRFGPIGEPN